jgi:predicted kinase
MKKIVIVIGQSASGKTTFVKKNFLGGDYKNLNPQKLIKCCVSGSTILLGHYNLDKRCEGTDTLSNAALPVLIEWIPTVLDKYEVLIAEGDLITSRKFFDLMEVLKEEYGVSIELYYFSTTIQNSIKRREETGSKSSKKFVKTTQSKSHKMYLYGEMLGFKCIERET